MPKRIAKLSHTHVLITSITSQVLGGARRRTLLRVRLSQVKDLPFIFVLGNSSCALENSSCVLFGLLLSGKGARCCCFLKDLLDFIRDRKKWLLAPLIIILLLVGVLIVIGGSSAIAPFIYSIF